MSSLKNWMPGSASSDRTPSASGAAEEEEDERVDEVEDPDLLVVGRRQPLVEAAPIGCRGGRQRGGRHRGSSTGPSACRSCVGCTLHMNAYVPALERRASGRACVSTPLKISPSNRTPGRSSLGPVWIDARCVARRRQLFANVRVIGVFGRRREFLRAELRRSRPRCSMLGGRRTRRAHRRARPIGAGGGEADAAAICCWSHVS